MEFKSLLNIETSFRQLRLYALIFAGICAVVTITAVSLSYAFAERQREKIYVLDNGRSLMVALSDKSALSYYKLLQEKGFFNRLIAANISQMVHVDSIRCNFDRYPYEATTYARQRIMRENTITERSLVTTCRLVNVSRSDNNPQGFLVEDLMIVENKDLQTYDR